MAVQSKETYERRTSITAHIVTCVSVTMSTAEMDLLCGILSQARDLQSISATQHDVISEFINAVNAVK